MNPIEVNNELNHQSGILAAACSQDMRDILKQNNSDKSNSTLAIKMYFYRIKQYIGTYLAVLSTVDAIFFSAGVGKNSAKITARYWQQLGHLSISINAAACNDISSINSRYSAIKRLFIKTNEQRQIANEVSFFLNDRLPTN